MTPTSPVRRRLFKAPVPEMQAAQQQELIDRANHFLGSLEVRIEQQLPVLQNINFQGVHTRDPAALAQIRSFVNWTNALRLELNQFLIVEGVSRIFFEAFIPVLEVLQETISRYELQRLAEEHSAEVLHMLPQSREELNARFLDASPTNAVWLAALNEMLKGATEGTQWRSPVRGIVNFLSEANKFRVPTIQRVAAQQGAIIPLPGQ